MSSPSPRQRRRVGDRRSSDRRDSGPAEGAGAGAETAAGGVRSGDLALLADFRGAGNRGEWELRYQPKVLARGRGVGSVEALLRWEHPSLGAVSPDRFVLVAERGDMLGEMTRWVISEALDAQVRWRTAAPGLRVAVNLSGLLVGDADLLSWLRSQLEVRGLGPSCLTIEVTETADMGDTEVAARFLGALRALGVRVSIDDFGTGYTSLSALTRLPLDELKIDQAFVRRSATSAADEAVIRSVCDLGHRLGLVVVAEGIEDEPTASRLTDFGADVLQGFFFSEPLDEDALIRFVSASPPAIEPTVRAAGDILRPR